MGEAREQAEEAPAGIWSAPPRWLHLLGLAISFASLVGVIVWATGQPTPQLPSSSSELGAFAGALCLYALTTPFLRGERWRLLLRHAGGRPPRADCYALMAIGYMGNTVLPARSGDAMRAVMISPRAGVSIRVAIGTMIAERLLDAVVLVSAFAVIAYGLLPGVDTGRAGMAILVAGGAVIAVALAVAVLYMTRTSPRIARLIAFLTPIAGPIRQLRGAHGLRLVLFTALIWSIDSAMLLAAAAAVGFAISPLEALFVLSLTGVVMMIPSGPGGLGTFDAGVVVGARAVGASGGVAVSYLLLLRFIIFVPITIAGLILLFVRYGALSRLRPRAAAAPDAEPASRSTSPDYDPAL